MLPKTVVRLKLEVQVLKVWELVWCVLYTVLLPQMGSGVELVLYDWSKHLNAANHGNHGNHGNHWTWGKSLVLLLLLLYTVQNSLLTSWSSSTALPAVESCFFCIAPLPVAQGGHTIVFAVSSNIPSQPFIYFFLLFIIMTFISTYKYPYLYDDDEDNNYYCRWYKCYYYFYNSNEHC